MTMTIMIMILTMIIFYDDGDIYGDDGDGDGAGGDDHDNDRDDTGLDGDGHRIDVGNACGEIVSIAITIKTIKTINNAFGFAGWSQTCPRGDRSNREV